MELAPTYCANSIEVGTRWLFQGCAWALELYTLKECAKISTFWLVLVILLYSEYIIIQYTFGVQEYDSFIALAATKMVCLDDLGVTLSDSEERLKMLLNPKG